ncbi:MAG: C2 family cysteine protease [Candidatus Obscuribacterales bacterium]|nr:C2 family cysteine protease [Candidatus Obscuribacterales bacterium]
MNKTLLTGIAAIVVLTSTSSVRLLPAQAVEKPAAKKMLQGKTSANQTIDQLESVGIKCVLHEGQPNKLVIDKVRMGSAASYKGVSEGDIVAAVTPAKDGFNLDFSRAGNQYRVFLRSQLAPPSHFKDDSEADKFLQTMEKQIADTQEKRNHVAQLEKDAPKYKEQIDKQNLSNKSAAKAGENAVSAEEIGFSRSKAIKQTNIPNCWFEAALAAVVDEPDGHKKVAEMIKKVDENNYRVTFPDQAFYGAAKYVDVAIWEIEASGVKDTTLWARALDCACAKRIQGDDRVENKSGLKMLSGLPTHEIRPYNSGASHVAEALEKICIGHEPAIMGTYPQTGTPKLPENHAFTVVAFDKKSKVVTLRNPWSGDPLSVGKQNFSVAEPITDEDGVRQVGDGYLQVTLDTVVHKFSGLIWAGAN